MSPFFTGEGDDGITGMLGESRIPKHDLRIEALGCLDEANAALGVARAAAVTPRAQEILLQAQRHLYQIMAEASASIENSARFRAIGAEQISWLEGCVDELELLAKLPREFIVPGDTPAGAALDMARAIVRRAERRMVELRDRGDITNPDLLRYLNRLSSLCFALEIYENAQAGQVAVTLAKPKRKPRP